MKDAKKVIADAARASRALEIEIESVWDRYSVTRIPGHDMTNECRLAARIVALEAERDRVVGPCASRIPEGIEFHACGLAGVMTDPHDGLPLCRDCVESQMGKLERIVDEVKKSIERGGRS